MIRRNARLRREYLYRKSLEGKEREEYERKRKIRQALEGIVLARCVLSCLRSLLPTVVAGALQPSWGRDMQSSQPAAHASCSSKGMVDTDACISVAEHLVSSLVPVWGSVLDHHACTGLYTHSTHTILPAATLTTRPFHYLGYFCMAPPSQRASPSRRSCDATRRRCGGRSRWRTTTPPCRARTSTTSTRTRASATPGAGGGTLTLPAALLSTAENHHANVPVGSMTLSGQHTLARIFVVCWVTLMMLLVMYQHQLHEPLRQDRCKFGH